MMQLKNTQFLALYAVVVLLAVSQVLGQGTVLVSDADADKIVRFQRPSGSPLQHFVGIGVSSLDDARGMSIGPDGHLYVASYDSSSILKFDRRTGEPLGEFVSPGAGGLFRPGRITFGPDGNLYVTSWNNPNVLRFDGVTGAFMDVFIGTQPVLPDSAATGLAFSPINGDLCVGSYGDSSVMRYDSNTGEFVEYAIPVGAGLWLPDELLFDDAGTLFVASFRNDSVWTLPEGGVPTLLISGGTGGLSRPTSLAIDPATQSLLVLSTNVSADSQVLEFNKSTGAFVGVYLDSLAGGLDSDPNDIHFVPDISESDFDRDGDVDLIDFAAFQLTYTGPDE